jgi:hypothetical protein
VSATELFEELTSIPGSQSAGAGDGIAESNVLNGIEFARTGAADERKMRSTWKKRQGGGATPLLLIADDPEGGGRVRVLGPGKDAPLRRMRGEALAQAIEAAAGMSRNAAIRKLANELERLDADGVPGLVVRGLGTRHLYRTRLREREDRWGELEVLAAKVPTGSWREVLDALGYELTELPGRGYVARARGKPAIVVFPRRSPEEFARLDESGRLPEGALLAACDAQGAPYGILAAGSRMRLLRASGDDGGASTRYLELDPPSLEREDQPLLGLLSPRYLLEDGLEEVLREARDYGSELRERLDRALREDVLPVLGRELGNWAKDNGEDLADDVVRADLEAASLTFVFRALFLLYAESAGFLPMDNRTYSQRSLTRIAERAAEELESADARATSLWRDIESLVQAMRTGQSAWGVPAYNGALFSADEFDGAAILERAAIPDRALAPALVALARDAERPDELGVDFSGLEIGHVGHIYEGLLSLSLSQADRDFDYDRRQDRYVAAGEGEPDVRAGDLFWLTNEGGRKGGGVYYTRTDLVRHLVRQAVKPAFAEHLEEVRATAQRDPSAAASELFDFYVIDPACGSAHFLVEVVDELADQIAALLGEVPMPALRDELDSLRATASGAIGVRVEDTALLKRLALKRCVYGVDLSPMGAEIAKVSLWLSAFVPGLSLAYLDHNVRVGNSLIGVARAEAVKPPGGAGQVALFGEQLEAEIAEAAGKAGDLRQIDDRSPEEVAASRALEEEMQKGIRGAAHILDLWTAEPLGLSGAREEAELNGAEIIAGAASELADRAQTLAEEQRALHWPLAFPEVFDREQPGFDVIVGNPPWEEVTIEELAFYALYRPGLRGLPEAERRGAIAELLSERPELLPRLERERERLAALRRSLGPEAGYQAGAGDPDVYKYFCQRYRELLRGGGRLGVVLPRTVFLAKGSAEFRRWLFEQAAPERIDFLLNNRLWLFDTHPQYTVALLAARNDPPTEDQRLEAAGVARSALEFARQSQSPGLSMPLTALGPNLEVPLLPDQPAADLLTKLRAGGPFPLGGGRWQCFAVAEFHETADAALWRDAKEGWPLWKGESFDQYDPHGAEARSCPPGEEAMAKARKPRPGLKSLLAEKVPVAARRLAVERAVGSARVAFRDVTNRTNSRTVLACLVPAEHFLTNKAPYLAFVEEEPRAEAACLALMNSAVFDWQARRFVEINLNFFILEGLRLPDLSTEDVEALARPAARLSCPDDRFAEFAEGVGVECGPLEEGERARLRAEIDARVARIWGLTAEELEIVFADFTESALPEDYRQAVRQRFGELGP